MALDMRDVVDNREEYIILQKNHAKIHRCEFMRIYKIPTLY